MRVADDKHDKTYRHMSLQELIHSAYFMGIDKEVYVEKEKKKGSGECGSGAGGGSFKTCERGRGKEEIKRGAIGPPQFGSVRSSA